MITIHSDKLGKRFNREWIFRNFTETIEPAEKLVVTGSNGSGKSTLLLILAGYILPSEGTVSWQDKGVKVDREGFYKQSSFASPALELIEEYTALEIADHQNAFKPFLNKLSPKEVLEIAELDKNRSKFIKHFSSGMKQRLKLALAVLADAPVLLLDEPVTNLDKQAINWYAQLIQSYAMPKTIIVCSNQISEEYFFSQREISINHYKSAAK